MAEGSDPEKLHTRIMKIPRERQLVCGSNFVVARSYRLDQTNGDNVEPILTRAEARIGLILILKSERVNRYPAQMDILDGTDSDFDLPDDLFAVLGWDWGLIRRNPTGWSGKLRVRGNEPGRSRRLELKFDTAIGHLVSTLAQSPSSFHQTRRRARWNVVF